jgi:mycofactocin system glycosyltransferase
MDGFGFSLAANTFLKAFPDDFFLISRLPLKVLRINESLFRLLEHIRDGGGLAEFHLQNPDLNPANDLKILLSLVAKGYLNLDKIASISEYPLVSVIIPVRDQPEDLLTCLQSLKKLDYPGDHLEIIVVDDGSQKEVSQIVRSDNASIIRHSEAKGPAACRNIGATNAHGDIFAFLDADCVAGENWLKETIPFFLSARTGAVGGYVDGYYQDTFLDRYEKTFSSLNMGKRLILEDSPAAGFYVPTANLLVARGAFTAAGGFKEDMRLGEDVDFCWRLRDLGYSLVYAPFGSVAHKHRSRLGRMLKRRGEYGTSEARLYRSHRDKRKGFYISLYAGLSFLALALAILLLNPYPLCAIPLFFGIDLWRKSDTVKKLKMELSFLQLVSSALRSYLSFFYFVFFHLTRYYLILIVGLGFLWHPLWIFVGVGIIFTSIVDYCAKKPALLYPVFLFFYLLEHLAYQIGVFWGCLKHRYFGSYLLSFKRA